MVYKPPSAVIKKRLPALLGGYYRRACGGVKDSACDKSNVADQAVLFIKIIKVICADEVAVIVDKHDNSVCAALERQDFCRGVLFCLHLDALGLLKADIIK